MRSLLIGLMLVCLAAPAFSLEHKAVQMAEDYGSQPPYDRPSSYYYYVPCTTSSWFWEFTDWEPGDVLGVFYAVGDPSMGIPSGDPPSLDCANRYSHRLEYIRILDFAGYGTIYPGLFTTTFDVWCADANGCPVGPSLWSSGPTEFCHAGWNYVAVGPDVYVDNCYTQIVGNMRCYPRFLITAKMTGLLAKYPAWGFDNVSTPLSLSCAMHDDGCYPALYPRPSVNHYPSMHSGYYGQNFSLCPPVWFLDPGDSVGNVYGCIELAWRVYVELWYSATEPTTWGNIKSIYK
jgi:hypothetical protein